MPIHRPVCSVTTSTSQEWLSTLEWRVRCEFVEMPGLQLTPAQGARLWSIDRETSETLLEGLTGSGFLRRTHHGTYVRPSRA
ncbi:MAG: hypothetical protein AB7I50_16555 [Vicinamibacterales bacterium]